MKNITEENKKSKLKKYLPKTEATCWFEDIDLLIQQIQNNTENTDDTGRLLIGYSVVSSKKMRLSNK